MAWTESQRQAIETRDKNLLVAAAAGSGKTAVLVERIIRQILAGECDVDRILVVTFTHAAAEEMRVRIESALRRALEEEREESKLERLERQMVLLSGASISTLHSFCQTVIRQNFEAVDLDPEFRLGGEQELRLMEQEVLEELFEESYEGEDEGFLRFVDVFGGDERGDEKLYELVLRLYTYSRSQPFPEEWLSSLPEGLDLPEGVGLEETPWYASVEQEIRLVLEQAKDDADHLLDLLGRMGAGPYAETVKAEFSQIQALLETLEGVSWKELREAFSTLSFDRLKRWNCEDKETKEAASQAIKKYRDHYKKALEGIRKKYFQESPEELAEDLRIAARDVGELCSVTRKFAEKFARAKHEKALADFNDLEHFALEILCASKGESGDALVPSEVAKSLQQRFQGVMVDEYQDTNGVQEAILSLVVSRERPNLFCVGDVKQSIYRFRLADPTLFLKKYLEYPHLGENYARIDLAKNFRSRPGILSAINSLFAQVMSRGTMELEYDEAAALYPGLEYPLPPEGGKCLDGPVEVSIIFGERDAEAEPAEEGSGEESGEAELKGLELEARWIAGRIQTLMEENLLVFDKGKGTYRPLRWRDIIILLRSVKGKAEKVLSVLHSSNIPAYASVDAGYFEEPEIRIMLSLLAVLHNARQDIPLAAVLASPIGGFRYEELAKIRLTAPVEDLYGAILAALSPDSGVEGELLGKIASFLERLSRWRMLARELSVPQLLWQLYRETGYYDYVGGLPGGLLRQANLRMLVDRAAEYEKTEFRGLFRFLRFVDRMRDMDTDLAVARVLGENEDVVRIMSIHKSKGLEFPVVILGDLGKKFNLQDASSDLLMHRELGLGPYRVEKEGSFRYPTFARQAIATKIRQENKAEELRVLYVAMTRAREKLILLGTVSGKKTIQNKVDRWTRYGERTGVRLPEYGTFAAESFLDWVAMAVVSHKDGEVLREMATEPCSCRDFLDYEDTSRWKVQLVPAGDIRGKEAGEKAPDEVLKRVEERKTLPDTLAREKVRELLDWQYDRKGLGKVPSKLSVTEIKRRFQEPEEGISMGIPASSGEWKRPLFLQEKRGLTAVEYGTLMHSVMQHIDPRGDVSQRGIEAQVREMVEREILLPEHQKILRMKTIRAFFTSSVGKRLRKAKEVWRELPFSRMLPAGDFYEGAEPGEEIFIQGIIDLLFEEEDRSLVLVDYKTDGDTSPERVKEEYRIQISLYSRAVESILQRKVKEKYLYMLHDGTVVEME